MSISPEFSRSNINPERHTGLRFSLAYEPIQTQDYFIQHVSGRIRMLRYPNPGKYRIGLRETLRSQGLMLGTPLSNDDTETQVFKVPESARPLEYDASSRSVGAYSYDDTKLFSELGIVLGKVAKVDSVRPNVLRGSIGRSIAIVDFTKPGDSKLQLVPGSEVLLFPLSSDEQVVDYYEQELETEFGNRFGSAKNNFRLGFSIGASKEDI